MVIFLHGAINGPFAMKRLDTAFAMQGYETFNWDWDGRNHSMQWNAARLDSLLYAKNAYAKTLHFVTHSMGALVVRYYLDHYPVPHLGRFVMIAPPNQGSAIATELQDFPPFQWIYKGTVDYLTTGEDAFADTIGTPPCEFGIIAGGTGGKYGYTWYLPGDDDSILSVDNTRLEGAADFMVINDVHSTIMIRDETIRNALHFIKHGNFIHSANSKEPVTATTEDNGNEP
ncbi:MAG TPA: hypothetical protein VKA68_05275 [bacterium]|nr:hypothetical protein [bacterium]